MFRERYVLEQLFATTGITINGNSPWDMHVRDERIFPRLLQDKSLGLGESYMEGWWDCRQLDEFVCKILTGGLERRIKDSLKLLVPVLSAMLFNMQSKIRSRVVAEQHYDLDDELFMSFLDPYNQYSCAYFDGTENLNEAQLKKMDMTCKKLNLGKDDNVLDIGCGWGGLAKYMAERYGCKVVAINISEKQINYAKEFCKDLPVEILQCDYRDLRGSFDKIVSVGMFEHVGAKNYRTFMKTVHRCLKDTGIFLLHTIGGNESMIACDPWINKYIFPNGMLPSISQISKAAEGLFVTEDLHNLGPHYEKTLMAWHANFQSAWTTLRRKYDEKFKRMWDYYLLSCAGAFRARSNQIWQIVFTKYGAPQPSLR
ncbi:MAG TPA: cyclopropane fatty acyl phospholipid synthase [Syntrophales bacterium]